MDKKSVAKWLLILLVVGCLVVYFLFPALAWAFLDALGEHANLTRAQWHRRHSMGAQDQQPEEEDAGNSDEEDSDEQGMDYTDYTPASSTRVRIVHPKTADALQRLLTAGRTDHRIVSQIVVPSSTQYPNVTAERPIVITTYR